MNTETITFENENSVIQKDSTVVRMEHLKKSFGNNHVLRDINLVINKGENVVILGQSGTCLLYTSDAADERSSVDLGGRRIIKKKKQIKKKKRNNIQKKKKRKRI